MILETERLLLRPFVKDDFEAYYETIYGDSDVQRYLPSGGAVPRDEARERFFTRFVAPISDPEALCAAVDRSSNRLIGHAGLKALPESEFIEVFYAFGKAWWGKGIATEAALACLHYGFDDQHLDRIVGIALPQNIGSRRVLEKCGMTYRGMRRYYNFDVAFHDETKEEFAGLKSRIPH
jgi:[ribosomal protein S5]-alanine N-acetyltransferase